MIPDEWVMNFIRFQMMTGLFVLALLVVVLCGYGIAALARWWRK